MTQRFLIYSPPRCGSTKLVFELDARVPDPSVVLCEPANVSREARLRFGSDYPHPGLRGLQAWLKGRSEIRGIKVVASSYPQMGVNHRKWVEENLDLFDRIVLLERCPVEICVSLAAARFHKHWNVLDQFDEVRDRNCEITPFEVTPETMAEVAESIASCRRVATLAPERSMTVSYPAVLERVGDIASFVGIAPDPLRSPRFDVRPVGTGVSAGNAICTNLVEIAAHFDCGAIRNVR